jgi:hypothetical protein
VIHLPTVIGLVVCEQLVVEKHTDNVSLINCFTIKKVAAFPSDPQRFAVVAFMTDGRGEVPMELIVKGLTDLEVIHRHAMKVSFPSRLHEVRFLFRVTDCVFPSPGAYDVCLLTKNELLAQHRISVR